MKKRISVPFLAAAIVVLALLAVIVIAKPFPQKASAVLPEKLLALPCTVAGICGQCGKARSYGRPEGSPVE